MELYTLIDEELDRMKREICDPIMKKTEDVVEEFFPMDAEYYDKYSWMRVDDEMKQMISIVQLPVSNIDGINADYGEVGKGKIEFMKQTIRRYGYLPLSYIDELRKCYDSLADSMVEILSYCKRTGVSLSAKDRSIKDECKKLLNIIEEADKELERVAEICKEKKNFSDDNIIKDYERIVKIQGVIKEKLELDEETELDDEIDEKQMVKQQEELGELKYKWQYQLREFLIGSFFVHRCKCYSNNVVYKTISEEELINLVDARANIKRKDYKEYIKKCIDTFAVINRFSANSCTAKTTNTIQYPEKSEEILFYFLNTAKWRDELREFDRIHREPKRMAKSLEEKFYRTEIADLENEVFAKREDYDYELCCAWNELGGFGISAIIAETMFYDSKIITKAYLTKKERKMEEFYYELERCCKVLIDFSKTESWLMGMELTHIVCYMYRQQWENKKPSLEELCVSMANMAEVLESIPLKKIIDNYSYKKQMIGWDGFPRRDFAVMWEDDKEKYEKYFYRKELEKYADRSNVNRFYVRVFQMVFRCVNSDSWK